jgi:hypothetical protein
VGALRAGQALRADDAVTPDRVAEALAALDAAVKDEADYKAGSPVEASRWYRSRELTIRAAPALAKLARLWIAQAPYGRQLTALDELADAVLGPEVTT